MLCNQKSIALLVMLISFFHICLKAQQEIESNAIDPIHYNIKLEVLDYKSKFIKGETTIKLRSTEDNVHKAYLQLKKLTIDTIYNLNQLDLSYVHKNDSIEIIFQNPLIKNDTISIVIEYKGIPFNEQWGGFHFTNTSAFNLGVGFESIPHNLGKAWFPCVDNFTDRAFYDYFITVKNTEKAVCGGILQTITPINDTCHTFHWKSNRTIPTYLASVAISNYNLVSDTFNSINNSIPITYYVYPKDTFKIAECFKNLKQIISIFEKYFGAYPFERIGITSTLLGAMEHAENIAFPASSIVNNTSSEWLWAHELAHTWFGNMVTCSSDAEMWLNEGWARWTETFFTENLYGLNKARERMRLLTAAVLEKLHLTEGGFIPLSPMPSTNTYGSYSYDKGAMVVHALRGYMGDSLFFKGIKNYLYEFAWRPVNSNDLCNSLSQSSGMDLKHFFNFYVLGAGYNHYSIDSFKVKPFNNMYEIEVFVRQKLRATNNPMKLCRFEVSFMNSNWDIITKQIEFENFAGSQKYYLPFIPINVFADFYEKAGDATIDKVVTIKNKGKININEAYCYINTLSITDSALIRITHNWVAPDTLKTPSKKVKLSNNRYWLLEGINIENMDYNVSFNYRKTTSHDAELIVSNTDSLIILYRKNCKNDWEQIPFTKNGGGTYGFITVNNPKQGEYTLAVYDKDVSFNQLEKQINELIIKPNPSKEKVDIIRESSSEAILSIIDLNGKTILTKKFERGILSITLDVSTLNNGVYTVLIRNKGTFERGRLLIADSK